MWGEKCQFAPTPLSPVLHFMRATPETLRMGQKMGERWRVWRMERGRSKRRGRERERERHTYRGNKGSVRGREVGRQREERERERERK